MSERPKIKDIAERAGVSVATVSRALSGSSLVTDETRKRVNALARELNYRPNVSARNLRTRRSMSVLLVVRDVGNPFYLEILKGVEATAREAGYAVLMGNTENDPDREVEYFNMLRDGHADGMILMTGKLPPPQPGESADLSHLPVVIALEMIEGSGFPHVQIDNVAAAQAAVEHLIALGHRRIAHIAGPLPEVMALHRRDGYRVAMKAASLEIPEGYEVRGDYLLESGEARAAELFALPEPPTAIFAANDDMAAATCMEAQRRGLRIPDDVAVASFNDIPVAQFLGPPLSTVKIPAEVIGETAVDLLVERLTGRDVAKKVILGTEMVWRGSTAAAGA